MDIALFIEYNQVSCLWLETNQLSCYVSDTYSVTNLHLPKSFAILALVTYIYPPLLYAGAVHDALNKVSCLAAAAPHSKQVL